MSDRNLFVVLRKKKKFQDKIKNFITYKIKAVEIKMNNEKKKSKRTSLI